MCYINECPDRDRSVCVCFNDLMVYSSISCYVFGQDLYNGAALLHGLTLFRKQEKHNESPELNFSELTWLK